MEFQVSLNTAFITHEILNQWLNLSMPEFQHRKKINGDKILMISLFGGLK